MEHYIQLDDLDIQEIEIIIQRLKSSFLSIENREFQKACAVETCNLPLRLRKYLTEIISNVRNAGYYIISGFYIDDEKIGDSPVHWDVSWDNPPYLREEIFQCLISSFIGSLFGWRTQENGRLLRHIVPIKKDENEQLGGSSKATLLSHTEEAFHPARADYFTLMCYRNTECVETFFINVNQLDLDEETRNILKQARFFIRPDESHMPHNNISNHWYVQSEQFNRVTQMLMEPLKCQILYGTKEYPMMTVDQAFMYVSDNDQQAKIALNRFHEALDEQVVRLILKPGDIVIIDNLTTAHARASYEPYYGPKQRWMRRVNIRNGRRAYMNYAEYDNSYIMK